MTDRCEKHPLSGGVVCGEFVCGSCYGERLLTEKMQKPRPKLTIDLTKGLFGRNDHYKLPEGE